MKVCLFNGGVSEGGRELTFQGPLCLLTTFFKNGNNALIFLGVDFELVGGSIFQVKACGGFNSKRFGYNKSQTIH